MQKPREYNLIEIEFWRRYVEMKRLRRTMLGILDYGWDGYELKIEKENV